MRRHTALHAAGILVGLLTVVGIQSAHAASRAEQAKLEKHYQLLNWASEGAAKYAEGNLADAMVALNKCIKLDSQFSTCHRILGLVYMKSGNDALVASEFRAYLKLNPSSADATALRDLISEYDARTGWDSAHEAANATGQQHKPYEG